MKSKLLFSAVLAVALTAPPAFAGGCVDDGMCIDGFQKFTVGGSSAFGGFGGGMFIGPEGEVAVNKTGYAFTETVITAAGDLCGIDCQSGKFTFKGAAGEQVDVIGWAKSNKPNETASVVNEGAAFSNATFQFTGAKLTPPSSGH